MPKRSSTNDQRDLSQLAKSIVDEATSDSAPDAEPTLAPRSNGKNPAAVALGKLGGKKGGPARANKLSKERRSEISKKAAQTRWEKAKERKPE